MSRQFRLSHDVCSDFYNFKKDRWYNIYGDFLSEEEDETSLKQIIEDWCLDEDFKRYNPRFDQVAIEFR